MNPIPLSARPGGRISELARLFTALEFAARKHRNQRRKDVHASPYINHPIEVAAILANIGGVTDLPTLIAAVLHDTIEDTETSPEELETHFGPEVRALVVEVTDDKRLPKEVRKQRQIEHAPGASVRAKILKLADKSVNVFDVVHDPPSDWTVMRRREYIEWAERVVAGCRGVNEALERHFDDVVATGKTAVGRR